MLGNASLLGITLLLMQGLIYIYQLGGAAFLPATSYDDLRFAESAAAVGALAISFGLPSIALVRIGSTSSEAKSRRLILVTLTGMLILIAIWGVIWFAVNASGIVSRQINEHAAAIFALSALMATRLCLTSAVQSYEEFAALASSTAIASCASIAALGVAFAAGWDAFPAWLAARAALETVAIALLSLRLTRIAWPTARQHDDGSFIGEGRQLVAAAMPVGTSLLARSLVEHGPVLWLGTIGASSALVAQVGLMVTIIGVAMIPSSIIQGAIVPRIARIYGAGAALGGFIGVALVALTVSACAFTVLVAGAAQLSEFGTVLLSPLLILAGLGIMISKVVANAGGGWLLIQGRWNVILSINVAALIVFIGIAQIYMRESTTFPLMILAVLAIELFATILYVLAALLSARRRSLE